MKNFFKNQTAVAILFGALIIALGIIGYALINKDSNSGSGSKKDVLDSIMNGDKIFQGADFKDKEYILGNSKNDVTVVVYSDFECPFCKMLHENAILQLQEKYSTDSKDISKAKIGIVYRHFAQSYHEKAPMETNAALCSRELYGQNVYANFIDRLYNLNPVDGTFDLATLPDITEYAVKLAKEKNQSVKKDFDKSEFTKCLSSETYNSEFLENMQDAVIAGLEGTPYSVITYKDGNDQTIIAKVSGAKDASYYEKIIDKLLSIK
ncbi:hypothetical protein SDC9_07800 [bioreactor metagenome]|uniref:Thioredoxin-like fold domain-containing protein n=1 Tax=bioreactor metagenome TaxID=1076179 RepID=A0A644T5I6_9ZZZZ|nr:thioredoxin domain-containing protein [Candidatus Elulimicrobiales bacterium]